MATSSVWREEQWSDVLHDNCVPLVTAAAPVVPLSGSTELSVKYTALPGSVTSSMAIRARCFISWEMQWALLAGRDVTVTSATGGSHGGGLWKDGGGDIGLLPLPWPTLHVAEDAGGLGGVGEPWVIAEALAVLCHGHPESPLHEVLGVAVKGPSNMAGRDIIHPGGEVYQSGLAAGAAPPRRSQHCSHGAVLHHFQTRPLARGERGEDGRAVVHCLHVIQAQDVVGGPSAMPRHGPHDVQPGLRPLPQVCELRREGQPRVQPHPEVLVAASPSQPDALNPQLAGRIGCL